MKKTPEDVKRTLVNPIYVGLGPFPPIIEREQWLRAATKLVKDIGPRKFFELMLEELDASLKAVEQTVGERGE